MSRGYDCADETRRKEGITDAASAVRRGELVVLPTDTVYGIGADAFSPGAVAGLLTAKGRGREMPPPVLVGSVRAAQALVEDFGRHGRDLIDEFWPGPLTVVCAATPSLSWDLGDTKGTVAVRMPLQPVALELLKEVGPTAVTSANVHGQPPATTVEEASEQLGESVSVYLDGGACDSDVPSTIVDLTYAVPRLLRPGAIPIERLREVCGTVLGESRRRASRAAQETERDEEEPDTPDPDAQPQVDEAGTASASSGNGTDTDTTGATATESSPERFPRED